MKSMCPECNRTNRDNSQLIDVNVPLNESGIYTVECSFGHKTRHIMGVQHFEVLFELGIMSLLDGYYRESIPNFTAAYERFYEYCIHLFLIKNNVGVKERKATWKRVSNNSEYQAAAFYYMYLNEFKEVPPEVDQKKIKAFRNKVVHKGYFPQEEETLEYARYCYEYIVGILQKMFSNEEFRVSSFHFDVEGRFSQEEGLDTTSIVPITMIGTQTGAQDFSDRDFDERLDYIKNHKRWIIK
ncbi:hypothetical protein SAMN05421503_1454 [Terribacillus aidingensis]|uniref:Uncharacterized protein n=1 Tax=Terribacillus aidingensis TaxID=586416 RepID=A0A285NKH0_9BACI|nr:hypothetical protein SAMN05421503_1454 [Terribacillus aidingensis]